jgi:phosphohistidine swiveling domain-containing protein/transcriptional regulator with XRE-family HTH domain
MSAAAGGASPGAPGQKTVPVDEYVGIFYPGYQPTYRSQPFVYDPVGPFTEADNKRFWFRDALHFGRGMVPASIALVDEAQSLGAQSAAEIVGVPPVRGTVDRFVGTHVYLGAIDIASSWEIEARAGRFSSFVSPILADFDSYWASYERELRAGYEHFDRLELGSMGRDELWQAVRDAYQFHRRGWYIHFEAMYVLITNYLSFYELAKELDLEPSLVSRYLAGRPTFYLETDERLWDLAARARELGVADALLSGDPRGARGRVEALPRGQTWWRELTEFLEVYGWRMEETCTIDTPSWVEDPAPALYRIAALLSGPEGRDFKAARQAAVAEREQYVDEARSKLGGGEKLRRFEEALATNQKANFAWWNDEHNALLDRRLAIPVRRATLELGDRLANDGVISQPDDLFFVFKSELLEAMEAGGAEWARLRPLVPERRAFFEEWRAKGPELPPVLGTIPPRVEDPTMIEVFGMTEHYLETGTTGAPGRQLRGFPASRGVVEGVARVVNAVGELDQLRPGEILVCGGTTTEWTAAFGYIKACVCDGGGSLTHAAIVSREYGIPCVVGTATATATIKTGDRVRVDGGQGTVEILGG